jgi:hypothetical protein
VPLTNLVRESIVDEDSLPRRDLPQNVHDRARPTRRPRCRQDPVNRRFLATDRSVRDHGEKAAALCPLPYLGSTRDKTARHRPN